MGYNEEDPAAGVDLGGRVLQSLWHSWVPSLVLKRRKGKRSRRREGRKKEGRRRIHMKRNIIMHPSSP